MTTTAHSTVERVLAPPKITVTQYSRRGIYMIWAAAALPMAILSWIVAPAVANGDGIEALIRPLIACLTVGLIWQFVLAMALVGHEQRTLRWSRIKEAMWLRKPRSAKTGRVGGKVWLIVVPLVVGITVHSAQTVVIGLLVLTVVI
jgi:uncharacterized protein